jgi:hypothetical protein
VNTVETLSAVTVEGTCLVVVERIVEVDVVGIVRVTSSVFGTFTTTVLARVNGMILVEVVVSQSVLVLLAVAQLVAKST